MKFRKKPVVIEATQWFKNGDHPLDYSSEQSGFQNGRLISIPAEHRRANNWEGDIVRYFRHPDKAYAGERQCEKCGQIMHKHGWIDTLEGGHIVCPGDWIITGVKGEHYPCKPDIFEMTYERVEECKEAEKQEPVAWMYVNTDGECEEIEYIKNEPIPDDPSVTRLYAAPRQWQGLTDEELAEFSDLKLGAYDLCLEVEAKLKEKNT